jgi:DNA polymerase-3 subunit delta
VKIDSEQLPEHLERRLHPLYTVYGEETLLALEAADRIRARARKAGHTERTVLIVESAFDWSELRGSAASLSLFGGRRLIELRIPSGKPGSEGAEALGWHATHLPPDTVTLVTLPRLDRTQLAAAWFQALESAGVAVHAQPVSPQRLPQWLRARLAQQSQDTDPITLAFLAGMVEGNLMAAQQELHKLALLFPAGRLTLAQVESAVTDVARYDVFKLGESILAGDRLRFVRMLHGLRGEGAPPPLVLWAIAEELRALLKVSSAVASGSVLTAVLREARVWGARAELLPRALRTLQAGALDDALLHAARIDRTIKGLERADVWDELQQLGLEVIDAVSGAPTIRGKIA